MTCQREKELLEQIEQTGQMYKVSALQLIKDGKRIAELEATLDRRALQFDGTHPAPCAKHCEATAFWIDERRLRARIAELEALNGALCRDSAKFVEQRDVSAIRAGALRNALESAKDSLWNYGCHKEAAVVEKMLALPDLSADILRARDARNGAYEMRRGARVIELFDDATMKGDHMLDSSECASILNALADELEQAK